MKRIYSAYYAVKTKKILNTSSRKPILQEIEEIFNDKETSWKCLPQDTKIQLLLEITSVISHLNLDPASVANIEYCSRRLNICNQ
jgi:hypothetical protein